MSKSVLVPLEVIERRILLIRGQRVMLDVDLADLYGVGFKQLSQQVRRNLDRFPDDFMFQLTKKEKEEVIANCNHLAKLRFSPAFPRAFTEHGTIMLANVLRSPKAAAASIQVV